MELIIKKIDEILFPDKKRIRLSILSPAAPTGKGADAQRIPLGKL
jgi:hypothetical protein